MIDRAFDRDTTRREVQVDMVRGGRVIAAPEIEREWMPLSSEGRRREREERKRDVLRGEPQERTSGC